jgi:hypothetical protein
LDAVEAFPMNQTRAENDYRGPERRRHQLFVTRNTEYHCKDGVCVAVRDRRSDTWLSSHLALHRRVTGGVRILANGTAIPSCDDPRIGEALYFGDDGQELITSVLCGVERPSRALVNTYVELS